MPATQDCAFNFILYGYEHRIPQRQLHQHVKVRLLTNLSLSALTDYRKPTQFTSVAELDSSRDDLIDVVIVGVMPTNPEQYTLKAYSDKKRANALTPLDKARPGKGRQSTKIESLEEFPVISYEQDCVRVAVELKDQKNVFFYGLVNPVDGVCEGRIVPSDHVFFFPEFRGDADSSRAARKGGWVRQRVRPYIKSVVAAHTGTSQVQYGPEDELANKLMRLASTYAATRQESVLEEIRNTLPVTDLGLESGSELDDNAIMRLLDLSFPFAENDSGDVILQSLELWPDLVKLKTKDNEVLMLAKELRKEHIVIEYRIFRALLVYWVLHVRSFGENGCSAAVVCNFVRLQLGVGV